MSHAPIRIICVEDSVDDAVMIRGMLRTALTSTGFDFVHLVNGDQIIERIKQFDPEVILLDYQLPGKDGLQLLGELAEETTCPRIMVTGKGDEAAAVLTMRAGATDYLRKEDLNPETLTRAIFRALATARYERARLAAEARDERAQAERDLVFANMDVAAVLLDRHGGVTKINEKGIATFGWTPLECVGKHFHDLAHRLQPDEIHEDPFECRILDLLDQRGNGKAEDQYICRADGTFAMGELRIQSMRVGESRFGHLVTFRQTREDTEEEAMARSQSRELRDVVNVISHVVRTPMTPIMLELARLRRMSADDAAACRSILVMDRNLRRIQRVFEHALEVVSIRRGDLRVRKIETDLKELADEAIRKVSVEAKERSVDIEFVADAAPVTVDVNSITSALERLLQAALARTTPDHPIRVTTHKDGNQVTAVVEDFGAPIDEVQMGVLLDPFGFFVDDRTAGEHVEHALRFYSAKLHAIASGGTLKIDSGTSTRFIMTFPSR